MSKSERERERETERDQPDGGQSPTSQNNQGADRSEMDQNGLSGAVSTYTSMVLQKERITVFRIPGSQTTSVVQLHLQ